MNDANWFTVFMKAYFEKFGDVPPSKSEWIMIKKILKDIPTERLSK